MWSILYSLTLCKQLVGRKLSKAGIVGWLTEVLKEKCPSVIFHLELRIAVHFSLHFASDSPARLFEQKKENLSSSVSPWSHFVWQRPERRSFEVFGIVFFGIDSLEEFWIHCFAIDTRQLTFSFFCFNKAGATTINEACFVWTFPEKEWMIGQSSSLCLCMVFGPIQVWKNTEACSFRSLLLIIRQTDIVGSFSPLHETRK